MRKIVPNRGRRRMTSSIAGPMSSGSATTRAQRAGSSSSVPSARPIWWTVLSMLACSSPTPVSTTSDSVRLPASCSRMSADVKSSPRSSRRRSTYVRMKSSLSTNASSDSCRRAASMVRIGPSVLSESRAARSASSGGAEKSSQYTSGGMRQATWRMRSMSSPAGASSRTRSTIARTLSSQLRHLALPEQPADRQPQVRARLAVVRDEHAVPRLADGTLGDAERVEAVEERPALLEPAVAQERHALRVAQHLVAALAPRDPAALARVAQLGERRAAGVDVGQALRRHVRTVIARAAPRS